MKWGELKYWQKGGIIGAIIGIFYPFFIDNFWLLAPAGMIIDFSGLWQELFRAGKLVGLVILGIINFGYLGIAMGSLYEYFKMEKNPFWPLFWGLNMIILYICMIVFFFF